MNSIKNIANKESLGIFLGLVAAMVILLSQTFYFSYVESVEGKAVQSEQAGDFEDSDKTVIKMAHQALSSVAQFAIQNVLHFISEIYIQDVAVESDFIISYEGFTPYLKALFRLIISPNAP